jgi:flagellin
MNSILTNSQALSALQSLNQTQQDMNITQAQVSSGLAVQTAADNAAYWAIGQQLTSDSGIITSANTALQQSQAIMNTANSAINTVITTIDAIQSQITSAGNPGASLGDINSTLAALSKQLTQAVNGASFNGVNLLDGSQSSSLPASLNGSTAPTSTPLSFVSGYDGNAQGGSVSTISFTAYALTGQQNAANATIQAAPTTATTVTDPSLISTLEGLTGASGSISGAATGATNNYTNSSGVVTITSVDQAGDTTVSTYTGYSDSGQTAAATTNTAYSASNTGGASSWTVSTVITAGANNSSPAGLLVQTGTEALQGTYDLTKLGSGTGNTAVTTNNASDMLSAVNSALAAVKSYASSIGEAQNQMTTAATFNSALNTDYANGLSSLVDADMNTASTRLQALQTQEQLGIQSLSIANQNSQLILKLFNG